MKAKTDNIEISFRKGPDGCEGLACCNCEIDNGTTTATSSFVMAPDEYFKMVATERSIKVEFESNVKITLSCLIKTGWCTYKCVSVVRDEESTKVELDHLSAAVCEETETKFAGSEKDKLRAMWEAARAFELYDNEGWYHGEMPPLSFDDWYDKHYK